MRAGRTPRALVAAALRPLLTSPLVLCGLALALLATLAADRALRAQHEAAAARDLTLSLAARIAAEAAARSQTPGDGGAALRLDAGGGLVAEAQVAARLDGGAVRLAVDIAEQRHEFWFQRLPGGSPAALGLPFSAAPFAALPAEWVAANQCVRETLPEALPPDRLALAEGYEQHIVSDGGLALLRLSGGTDRPDFVFGPRPGSAQQAPSGHWLVDGNLWVDEGNRPLELRLQQDLTLHVRGNVYLGRSIRIHGPGHLTVVAVADGGVGFLDQDGNGRWSAGEPVLDHETFRGPVEGAGNVYLGLPRSAPERLEFDLALRVQGGLHVAAEEARVHGAVMVQGGGLRIGSGRGWLVATGARTPNLCRSLVPGFAAVGGARPGRLLPLGRQTLYPAAPTR